MRVVYEQYDFAESPYCDDQKNETKKGEKYPYNIPNL